MTRKVLILAPDDDDHGVIIREVLKNRFSTETIFWSFKDDPLHSSVNLRIDPTSVGATVTSNGTQHGLDSFHTAWFRRPGPVQPRGVSSWQMRRYCSAESREHVWGTFAAARVRMVNDPDHQHTAGHKAVQLRAASEVGLRIPKTLMSNHPESARDFIQGLDSPCIYKGFTQGIWKAVETREVDAQDIEDLDLLPCSPVIFQEKIPKGRDIRVNIFGSSVFAAYTTTKSPAAELDWRVDPESEWWPMDLPDDVAKSLCAVLQALKLDYGCFDLRETPDGEYVFLEVNPAGQFLWVEIWTEQPLAEAFCALLMERNALLRPAPSQPDQGRLVEPISSRQIRM